MYKKTKNKFHKIKPLLPWGSKEISHPVLVWRNELDNRYIVEVHQTGTYTANLYVFDHQKNDKKIACFPVGLLYGARFGPDVSDTQEWQEKVINFIDNTYNKKRAQQ